jgi:histidinol dehydrogenase
MLGSYSPAVLGDYVAGPSHELPTAERAYRLPGLRWINSSAEQVWWNTRREFEKNSAGSEKISPVWRDLLPTDDLRN